MNYYNYYIDNTAYEAICKASRIITKMQRASR